MKINQQLSNQSNHGLSHFGWKSECCIRF